jgi:hypothetical protein
MANREMKNLSPDRFGPARADTWIRIRHHGRYHGAPIGVFRTVAPAPDQALHGGYGKSI